MGRLDREVNEEREDRDGEKIWEKRREDGRDSPKSYYWGVWKDWEVLIGAGDLPKHNQLEED